jgi:hypothetical protein
MPFHRIITICLVFIKANVRWLEQPDRPSNCPSRRKMPHFHRNSIELSVMSRGPNNIIFINNNLSNEDIFRTKPQAGRALRGCSSITRRTSDNSRR